MFSAPLYTTEILDHLLLVSVALDGTHTVTAAGRSVAAYQPDRHRLEELSSQILPHEMPELVVVREFPDNPHLLVQRPGFALARLTPEAVLATVAEAPLTRRLYAARRGQPLPLILQVPQIASLAVPDRPRLRYWRAVAQEDIPGAKASLKAA